MPFDFQDLGGLPGWGGAGNAGGSTGVPGVYVPTQVVPIAPGESISDTLQRVFSGAAANIGSVPGAIAGAFGGLLSSLIPDVGAIAGNAAASAGTLVVQAEEFLLSLVKYVAVNIATLSFAVLGLYLLFRPEINALIVNAQEKAKDAAKTAAQAAEAAAVAA